MRKLFSLLLLSPCTLFAQVSVDWVNEQEAISIALDNSNNVYTVYHVQAPGGDITVTKRDAEGNFIWDAFYDNVDNTKFESATWISVDNQNNVIVSGDVNSGIGSPVKANSIVMKFDPDGNLLWRNVYETPFDGSYTKRCMVDEQNNVYVLGMGTGPNGFVSKVKKFDADGAEIWEYYDSAGIGIAQNFKFSPDGAILISGRAMFGNLNGYAKIDLSGNHLWSIAGVPSLTVGDSDGDSIGNTYIVHAENAGGGGSMVKKISADGDVIWEHIYPLSAFRIEVGTDDMPVICGFPNSGIPGSSFVKLSSDGEIIWQNPNADGAYNLLMHAHLIMDDFNNIYLAASTLFEMAVCKVNFDGSNGWMQTCAGSYAGAISIGNDYNVYVAGGNTARFIQEQQQILGCTDLDACNFNPAANSDDGSCEYDSCNCLGDLNGDNLVTVADLLIFIPIYGCAEDCGAADLDGNGLVNSNDLLFLISNYGNSCQ